LSLRLWLLGYRCVLDPAVDVAHLFRSRTDVPEYQRDWETVLHNQLRLAVVHLNEDRVQRLVRSRAREAVFPPALTRLITSDAWSRRDEMHAMRCRDDDWYFRTFSEGSL
jgi:hypothetical protein